MILRLNPRWPIVWRNPTSVQIGVDPPRARIDDITPTQERMLAALEVGISETGLAMIARGTTPEYRLLMQLVDPVLQDAVSTEQPPAVAICGTGAMVQETARLLTTHMVVVVVGSPAVLLAATPRVAIIVGHFVLHPELHALWLRRDIAHIPVVFSDTALEIGPVVVPGAGPCLVCVELHRRDEDPARIAIATQLLGRHSSTESALTVAEGAAALCRLVLRVLSGDYPTPESVRIDATTGRETHRVWSPHPECGCRGISGLATASMTLSSDQSKIDSAVASHLAPTQRSLTRTGRAFGELE